MDNHEENKTKEFSRRDFLKAAGGTMALAAAIPTFLQVSGHTQENGQTQVTWDGSHAVSQYDPIPMLNMLIAAIIKIVLSWTLTALPEFGVD